MKVGLINRLFKIAITSGVMFVLQLQLILIFERLALSRIILINVESSWLIIKVLYDMERGKLVFFLLYVY